MADGPDPALPRERRLVTARARAREAVALITRDVSSRVELESALRRRGPVERFPSLAHFCTVHSAKERWAAVLIARPCAWDARLDSYVRHRGQLALFGEPSEHEWPAAVQRLASVDEVKAWLDQLEASATRSTLPRKQPPLPAVRRAVERKPELETSAASPMAEPPRTAAPRQVIESAPGYEEPVAPGMLLVVGESRGVPATLLASLRRARPVRFAASFSDVPANWRNPMLWTAVLGLQKLEPECLSLARDPSTCAVWREGTDGQKGLREPSDEVRELRDEASVLAWLSYVRAFEHTGHRGLSRAVEDAITTHGLAQRHAEVLAVATRFKDPNQRGRALGMTLESARSASRDFSKDAGGIKLGELARNLLDACHLPSAPRPKWAPNSGSREAWATSWDELRARLPDMWRKLPMSSVPALAGTHVLLETARRLQVLTLGELSNLTQDAVPESWHATSPHLRVIEEIFHHAPPRDVSAVPRGLGSSLTALFADVIATFPAGLRALAMELCGLEREHQATAEQRAEGGGGASTPGDLRQQVMVRFLLYLPLWRQAVERLGTQLERESRPFSELGLSDTYFASVTESPQTLRFLVSVLVPGQIMLSTATGHAFRPHTEHPLARVTPTARAKPSTVSPKPVPTVPPPAPKRAELERKPAKREMPEGAFLVLGTGPVANATVARLKPLLQTRRIVLAPRVESLDLGLQTPNVWTGIVIADPTTSVEAVAGLARDRSTILPWFPALANEATTAFETDVDEAPVDEATDRLFQWAAYVVTFEHTASVPLAKVVKDLAHRMQLPIPLVEIAALSTRFSAGKEYLDVLSVDKNTFSTESRRLLFHTKHVNLREIGLWILDQADATPELSVPWIPTTRSSAG